MRSLTLRKDLDLQTSRDVKRYSLNSAAYCLAKLYHDLQTMIDANQSIIEADEEDLGLRGQPKITARVRLGAMERLERCIRSHESLVKQQVMIRDHLADLDELEYALSVIGQYGLTAIPYIAYTAHKPTIDEMAQEFWDEFQFNRAAEVV